MNEINTNVLITWLDDKLKPQLFHDYAPNGLQLQGKSTIKKLVTGVTASTKLIDIAIEKQADAIFVHHGWFWKNESPSIVGLKYQRIQRAMQAGLNVFAYHLPLDAHPLWGNNVRLGQVLGLDIETNTEGQPNFIGKDKLILRGQLAGQGLSLESFGAHVAQQLQREPLLLGNPQQVIKNVAWCTGGAQGFFEEAIAMGVDAYITGEVSEKHFHLVQESGVAFIAAGHHATERYGAMAVGQAIQEAFGIEVEFVDIVNPV